MSKDTLIQFSIDNETYRGRFVPDENASVVGNSQSIRGHLWLVDANNDVVIGMDGQPKHISVHVKVPSAECYNLHYLTSDDKSMLQEATHKHGIYNEGQLRDQEVIVQKTIASREIWKGMGMEVAKTGHIRPEHCGELPPMHYIVSIIEPGIVPLEAICEPKRHPQAYVNILHHDDEKERKPKYPGALYYREPLAGIASCDVEQKAHNSVAFEPIILDQTGKLKLHNKEITGFGQALAILDWVRSQDRQPANLLLNGTDLSNRNQSEIALRFFDDKFDLGVKSMLDDLLDRKSVV